MLRPLLVTNDFLPDVGGIQQYVAQIAARLAGVGVYAPAHPAADDGALGYPVYRGPRRYLWPTATTLRSLRAAVAAHRATVLLFMAPAPLTPLGGRLGLPWAVVSHGAELVLPARLPASRQIFARTLRRADRLFAVSDYTATVLRELVGPDGPQVLALRNGVDLYRFAPDVAATPMRARYGLGDAPVVVTVGRLVPRKGQDQLIRALPEVRRRVPDTRLLIVGDGRDRARLARLASRHGDRAVLFTGRVDPARLPSLYRVADVFAHPNRSRWGGLEQEGFGVVFLEAQACGIPVVAGRSGGSPEAVVEGTTGLLVDGRNTADIADALVRLLADRSAAATMGVAGRAWVERHWSWDTIVAGLADDLGELAAAVS